MAFKCVFHVDLLCKRQCLAIFGTFSLQYDVELTPSRRFGSAWLLAAPVVGSSAKIRVRFASRDSEAKR